MDSVWVWVVVAVVVAGAYWWYRNHKAKAAELAAKAAEEVKKV